MRWLALMILLAGALSARATAPPPNTLLLGVDVFGRSLTSSLDVEYFATSSLALGVGLGYVPPIWTGDSAALPRVNLSYMPSAESTWYWAVGIAKAIGSVFDDDSIYGHAIYQFTVGYFDYRPGFFLRPLLTLNINRARYFFLPGITFGTSF